MTPRALRVLAAFAALGGVAAAAEPQPAAFAHGDPAAGRAMHDKDCVGCHARRFDGDASRIYLRPDRKVTSPEKLRAQVAYCNAELGSGYFPEEEEHLAAYLNLTYYRFKP